MARTSLRHRLQAIDTEPPQGREALYQSPTAATPTVPGPPVHGRPSPVNGIRSTPRDESWEGTHSRVTFPSLSILPETPLLLLLGNLRAYQPFPEPHPFPTTTAS